MIRLLSSLLILWATVASAESFPRAAADRVAYIHSIHTRVSAIHDGFWQTRTPLEITLNQALGDTQKFSAYLAGLAHESFVRQLESPGSHAAQMANQGEIDRSVILSILIDRFKAREGTKIGFVEEVDPNGSSVVEKAKEGSFVDLGLYLEGHGAFSHLVQMDYILTVAEASYGRSAPREFLDRLTHQSWAGCCDNSGSMESLHTASWIERKFLFWVNLDSRHGERRLDSLRPGPAGLLATSPRAVLNAELERLKEVFIQNGIAFPQIRDDASLGYRGQENGRKTEYDERYQEYLALIDRTMGISSTQCLATTRSQ